ESRVLPFGPHAEGKGDFKPIAILPCDVACDSEADITPAMRETKGYEGDVSIAGCVKKVGELRAHVDVVVHSVAFTPEANKPHIDTTRGAYLTAMSVSSYSLVAMARAFSPLM